MFLNLSGPQLLIYGGCWYPLLRAWEMVGVACLAPKRLRSSNGVYMTAFSQPVSDGRVAGGGGAVWLCKGRTGVHILGIVGCRGSGWEVVVTAIWPEWIKSPSSLLRVLPPRRSSPLPHSQLQRSIFFRVQHKATPCIPRPSHHPGCSAYLCLPHRPWPPGRLGLTHLSARPADGGRRSRESFWTCTRSPCDPEQALGLLSLGGWRGVRCVSEQVVVPGE